MLSFKEVMAVQTNSGAESGSGTIVSEDVRCWCRVQFEACVARRCERAAKAGDLDFQRAGAEVAN